MKQANLDDGHAALLLIPSTLLSSTTQYHSAMRNYAVMTYRASQRAQACYCTLGDALRRIMSLTCPVAYVAPLFDYRRVRRVHGVPQFGLLSVSRGPAFDAGLGL